MSSTFMSYILTALIPILLGVLGVGFRIVITWMRASKNATLHMIGELVYTEVQNNFAGAAGTQKMQVAIQRVRERLGNVPWAKKLDDTAIAQALQKAWYNNEGQYKGVGNAVPQANVQTLLDYLAEYAKSIDYNKIISGSADANGQQVISNQPVLPATGDSTPSSPILAPVAPVVVETPVVPAPIVPAVETPIVPVVETPIVTNAVVGTIPNDGAINITPSAMSQAIPAGYYANGGAVETPGVYVAPTAAPVAAATATTTATPIVSPGTTTSNNGSNNGQ